MKNATTADRLKQVMIERNLKQVDVLERCKPYCAKFNVKLNKNDLSQYVSGKVSPRQDKLTILALALNVDEVWLMGYDVPPNNHPEPRIAAEYVTFPVVGEIAAGFDHIAAEDWSGETVDVPLEWLHGRSKSEFFVLTVKGDSMFPTYQADDKVLILRQSTMNYSGEIGAVLYDGDCGTLKRVEYKTGEDWVRLTPVNPEYAPKTITGADLEQCQILGIPVMMIRSLWE